MGKEYYKGRLIREWDDDDTPKKPDCKRCGDSRFVTCSVGSSGKMPCPDCNDDDDEMDRILYGSYH